MCFLKGQPKGKPTRRLEATELKPRPLSAPSAARCESRRARRSTFRLARDTWKRPEETTQKLATSPSKSQVALIPMLYTHFFFFKGGELTRQKLELLYFPSCGWICWSCCRFLACVSLFWKVHICAGFSRERHVPGPTSGPVRHFWEGAPVGVFDAKRKDNHSLRGPPKKRPICVFSCKLLTWAH